MGIWEVNLTEINHLQKKSVWVGEKIYYSRSVLHIYSSFKEEETLCFLIIPLCPVQHNILRCEIQTS